MPSWACKLDDGGGEYAARFTAGSRSTNQSVTTSNPDKNSDKPFACPVPGCKKRYKNVNGIKYHTKNGHKNDGKIRKAYKCHCGKSYKTSYGLKNHSALRHNGTGPLQVKLPLTSKQRQLEAANHHQQNHRHHRHHHHHHHHQSSSSTTTNSSNSSSGTGSSARHHHHHHHHSHQHYQSQQRHAQHQQHRTRDDYVPKARISAIQDHGYIKQDLYTPAAQMDTESECEAGLGVLTPASSPNSSSALTKITSSRTHHQKYVGSGHA